jgi:hypothetical protein
MTELREEPDFFQNLCQGGRRLLGNLLNSIYMSIELLSGLHDLSETSLAKPTLL